MAYRGLADATVALHFAFILFAVFGGLLAWRRTFWAWLHLPAVGGVAYLEFTGAICARTPIDCPCMRARSRCPTPAARRGR